MTVDLWPTAVSIQCRCVWDGERCPNTATQEDGLCDWCGERRPEQLTKSRNAMFHPATGAYMGLGGGGERHVNPERHPDACWMTNSGRTLA
jgi:hypothetical protein